MVDRRTLRNIAGWMVAGYFAVALLGRCTPRDDTDPPDSRSGMRLWRDHLTGCEYLSPGVFGGLTPRLDANGRQICRATRPPEDTER